MFYMASTKIAPEKTAAEIQALLGKHGAKQILSEYENSEIVALSFVIEVNYQRVPFILPLRWEAYHCDHEEDCTTPTQVCRQCPNEKASASLDICQNRTLEFEEFEDERGKA